MKIDACVFREHVTLSDKLFPDLVRYADDESRYARRDVPLGILLVFS